MRYKSLVFLFFVFVLALVGCGGNNPTPEPDATPAEQETETAPDNSPNQAEPLRATITPESPTGVDPDDSYPAPAPALEEGYPSAMLLPRSEAYPMVTGHTWMIRPAGEQCGETEPLTLSEAVAALQEAGVTVQGPHTASLNVCQACGCPTSLHFWAQVPEASVSTAVNLGWQATEQ